MDAPVLSLTFRTLPAFKIINTECTQTAKGDHYDAQQAALEIGGGSDDQCKCAGIEAGVQAFAREPR